MHIPHDPLLGRDPLRLARNRLLTRITAPASEPLSLAETKLYLRIDHTEEDTLIGDLIVGSRMMAEHWLRQSLITQAWKLAYDDAIPSSVFLPMGPVTAINSVSVINRDGSAEALDSDTYWLDAAKRHLMLDSELLGFRIEMAYATGYGNAGMVPVPIRQGMLAHIAAMYDDRDGGDGLPAQSMALYLPFREIQL